MNFQIQLARIIRRVSELFDLCPFFFSLTCTSMYVKSRVRLCPSPQMCSALRKFMGLSRDSNNKTWIDQVR